MRCFALLQLIVVYVGVALGQYQTTTPVPILKQINRHNEDGSYSYGYEGGDGTYKIETKFPTGEVYGKYGFVDDTGAVREIEYGATKRDGFAPVGTGINVPPAAGPKGPNEVDSPRNPNEPEDDGQYREDPSVYHTDPKYTNGERYEEPAPKKYYAHQAQLAARPIVNYQLASPKPTLGPIYASPAPAAPTLRTAYPTLASPALRPAYAPQQLEYQPFYKSGQHQLLQPTLGTSLKYLQQPGPQFVHPGAFSSQILQTRYGSVPASNVNHGSYTVNYRR